MKIYNKLVRDNIPDIISSQGKTPITSTLADEDYKKRLYEKLEEEVAEFLEDESLGEICDIFEVLHAILNLKNITFGEMEKLRKEKALKNGTFSRKIFLEKII